jgi:hypothetical protein
LYYFWNRWYDAETGRFISEDPARDGNNWYAYCGNSPLSRIDPTGLRWAYDGSGMRWSDDESGNTNSWNDNHQSYTDYDGGNNSGHNSSGGNHGAAPAATTPPQIDPKQVQDRFNEWNKNLTDTQHTLMKSRDQLIDTATAGMSDTDKAVAWFKYHVLGDTGAYGDTVKAVTECLNIVNIAQSSANNARGYAEALAQKGQLASFDQLTNYSLGDAKAKALYGKAAGYIIGSAMAYAGEVNAAAAATIDPAVIRFSQNSISPLFKNGQSVTDLADGLASGAVKAADIPAIRLVEKDGLVFTLDNRRLFAFQKAGVQVPYRMATAEEAANEAWKFTTTNNGTSILIRGQ